ncbi:MAG: nitroreductase/quinone reductase family protein [Acidimicrobiales bacterium]
MANAMTEDELNNWNQQIMDEFRSHGGRVGGQFEGVPMVIVHHAGAKTGTIRHTPLTYLPIGEDLAIFGTKGGSPTNPAWYHNLIANPETVVELGSETISVRVREAKGAERDELFDRQKKAMPPFVDYEAATSRVIPVLVIERQ